MSEESKYKVVGELNQESTDLEVITWKLTEVSSILFAADYGVQSPPFSFANASWILKIFFCGQKIYNSQGYIDVVIERLHSEIKEHDIFCKVFCKNVLHIEFKPVKKNFSFCLNRTRMNIPKIMENFHGKLDKWKIAPNDSFTLVCEIEHKKLIPMMKSTEETSGKYENIKKSEVGEINKSPYQIETVKWTIKNASSLPCPANYQVQSPAFSFGGASWSLKIFPYFKLEYDDRLCFNVALTRLQSHISEHCISVNICFEDHIKEAHKEVNRSFIFDSDHMQGDPILFIVRKDQISEPHDTFNFFCKFRIKKNAENKSDSQTKDTNSTIGDLIDFKSGVTACFHEKKVLQDLKELFLKQEDCDAIIRVKGEEFPVHRTILKARSPVFYSTFRNDMQEKTTGVVDIEDCDPTTFSDFLCFLYCGDIENLSIKNVFSIFITADKYAVLDLRSECIEFMKKNLTVDSFCDIISLALQHSETGLIKLCTDFFAENLKKIIVTVKWQSFITKNPIQGNELMIKALIPDNN